MPSPIALLLIGDTIFNRTFRVRARTGELRHVPFSYLDEEWLELEDGPELTVQGIGYIARHLADRGHRPVVLTGMGSSVETAPLRNQIEQVSDRDRSHFSVDGEQPAIVTRILRKAVATRVGGASNAHRPQLRFDTPPNPPASLDAHTGEAIRAVAGGWALIRATNRGFFAAPLAGESPASPIDCIGGRVAELQQRLRASNVKLLLDIRPFPPDLRILDPETVLCTTIGRLADRFSEPGWKEGQGPDQAEALALRAFWEFSPARALVCFAGDAGTLVVERGAVPSEAKVHRLPPARSSEEDPDRCGSVTGGDAFIAGLFAELVGGAGVVDAAAVASAAFEQALRSPLGSSIPPGAARPNPSAGLHIREVTNPKLDRLADVIARIRSGASPCPRIPGVVGPAGGKLDRELGRFQEALERWRPRKGKDLIAIFGESRSGKEYPLDQVRKAAGYHSIGPVNMYQFLAEVEGCLSALVADNEKFPRPEKRVLLIDEITPGDSARSLLNLMGEKRYSPYDRRSPAIDFTAHPVILMSSMKRDAMIADLRGRVQSTVEIPPLRERWEEIPYLIPLTLRRVVDLSSIADLDSRNLQITYGLMTALLAHDYLPHAGAEEGSGLDQHNFRALDDLLEDIYRRAVTPGTGDIVLSADHLPGLLRGLAYGDDRAGAFLYPAKSKGAVIPDVVPR